MKYLSLACLALLLAGCPDPPKPIRHFVSCVSLDGGEVKTATLDIWQYEGDKLVGYNYTNDLAVLAYRVSVYTPPDGAVCMIMEDRT